MHLMDIWFPSANVLHATDQTHCTPPGQTRFTVRTSLLLVPLRLSDPRLVLYALLCQPHCKVPIVQINRFFFFMHMTLRVALLVLVSSKCVSYYVPLSLLIEF